MSQPESSRAQRALVLIGIVVLAFNLRPAAVSVGPLLDEITDGLGMSGTQAALLTSLPVLCFASVGGVAPRLGKALGLHRSIMLGLIAMTVGLYARAHVDGVWTFLALSFLALAGMAASNVLLPSLVKLHFPDRIGQVTGLYSTALAIGITATSTLSVPIAEHHRVHGEIDWRRGLVAWAITAAIAAVPWVGLLAHDQRTDGAGAAALRFADMARTRLAWAMAAFFGLQSMQAYAIFGWFADIFRDSGYSAHTAGLLLGVVTGISIPLSWLVPRMTARSGDPSRLLTALMLCYLLGYVGMLVAPHGGAVAWALLIGAGTTTFPMVLTLIGLRARSSAGTAALSGFTQSVGYLLAVVGPFGVGVLHDATGGWNVPILALLILCVPQYVVGLVACRHRYLEDELPGR
ncbi:CynX/NimT family MFS transporter [Nocardioides nematodiphilus]|uniref:CynX/NimT family MFS transporter n=1 Tax=Nocardioides nematodiphilus TaxID=2849669 RepID=UPI001CDA020C|nr:MFS transporter [Nocardioides nematodiphilus]MCA1984128.1 MFS transporter [Nocardioides nematodiphilus]